MDAAAARKDGARVNTNDLATRVGALQDSASNRIVGVVERTHDDGTVAHVVVDVAVVDPIVVVAKDFGCGDANHAQGRPHGFTGGIALLPLLCPVAQDAAHLVANPKVGVLGISL